MIHHHLLSLPKSITNHTLQKSGKTYQICTDSRQANASHLFVALKGERFDAIQFLDQVITQGTELVALNDTPKNRFKVDELSHPALQVIWCDDTLLYLQQLAYAVVTDWKKKDPKRTVIGITGSNGKTTTKNLLFHFLNSLLPGKVHATKGNFNNHIGVPLTLLGLTEKHQICISELGTNHPGEIKALCQIATPDQALLTSIGKSHLEFFHTTENVFKEKSELIHYVEKYSQNPYVVLNGQDPFLKTLKESCTRMILNDSSVPKIKSFEDQLHIQIDGSDYQIHNPQLMGSYNYQNMALTLCMTKFLLPETSLEKLCELGKKFLPQDNRSLWIEALDRKIYLDAYNANPSSMSLAIHSFLNYAQQNHISEKSLLLILGDMNELGDRAKEEHVLIGEQLAKEAKVDVLFIGKNHQWYREGYPEGSCFNSVSELKPRLSEFLKGKSHLFIKGSRSLQLESITDIKC